jgi:hypothetical protein
MWIGEQAGTAVVAEVAGVDVDRPGAESADPRISEV